MPTPDAAIPLPPWAVPGDDDAPTPSEQEVAAAATLIDGINRATAESVVPVVQSDFKPVPWTGQTLVVGQVLRCLDSDYGDEDRLNIVSSAGRSAVCLCNLNYSDVRTLYLPDVILTNGEHFEILPYLWEARRPLPHRIYMLDTWRNVPKSTLATRGLSGQEFISECGNYSCSANPNYDNQNTLRSLTIPIGDDGAPINPAHLALISAVAGVSDMLRAQIAHYPTAPLTRGLLRQRFLRPPPPEATTPEAILAWVNTQNAFPVIAPLPPEQADLIIEENVPTPAPVAPTPVPPTVRTRVVEETMPLDIDIDVDVSGSTTWDRTDNYSGRMEVPVSVIVQGEAAVMRYVRSHYMDELECEEGDERNHDSEDSSSERSNDDTDYADLLDRYYEAHPDEAT